jgi:YD repeat-containing protein
VCRSQCRAIPAKAAFLSFDHLARLTGVTYGDGTSVTVKYYDGNDNLRSITDSTGTTTFSSYDHRDRVTQKSSPRGTIKYSYDPVGNLNSKTDGSGTVTYVYDNVNRLKDLIDHGNFSPIHFLDYDDNDRPGTIIYNPAMTITRTWDGAGRALDISAAIQSRPVFDIGYDYYPGSNLLCSMFDNGTIAQYSYDALTQLTQERRVPSVPKALSACGQIFSGGANARTRDWTYDAHHNRATQAVTTYNYDAADELRQAIEPGSSPTTTYGYDRDANLTSRSDGLQLDYDSANRTVGITPPLSSGGAAKKLTLKYSGLGQTQRTSLQVGVALPTTFDYDGLGVGPSSSAQSVDSPSLSDLGPSGSISGLGSSGSLISVPLTIDLPHANTRRRLGQLTRWQQHLFLYYRPARIGKGIS